MRRTSDFSTVVALDRACDECQDRYSHVPHGAEAPHRLKTSLLVLALQVLGVLHFLTIIKEATKSVSQKIQRITCFLFPCSGQQFLEYFKSCCALLQQQRRPPCKSNRVSMLTMADQCIEISPDRYRNSIVCAAIHRRWAPVF